MSTDTLLSVDDVVALTSLAKSTVYTWRSKGVGPRSFKLRGRVVYRLSEIQSWLQEQEAATAKGDVPQDAA